MQILADSGQWLTLVVACGLLGTSGGVSAGDDELPDTEFLEYLGSWEQSDEDWLLVTDLERVRKELTKNEQSDSELINKESTEIEDEG